MNETNEAVLIEQQRMMAVEPKGDGFRTFSILVILAGCLCLAFAILGFTNGHTNEDTTISIALAGCAFTSILGGTIIYALGCIIGLLDEIKRK